MEFRERHSLGLIRGLQRDFSVSLWMVKLLALLSHLRSTTGYNFGSSYVLTIYKINDIHENLDSTLRLYADDELLYRSITTMNDSVILQNDIDK